MALRDMELGLASVGDAPPSIQVQIRKQQPARVMITRRRRNDDDEDTAVLRVEEEEREKQYERKRRLAANTSIRNPLMVGDFVVDLGRADPTKNIKEPGRKGKVVGFNCAWTLVVFEGFPECAPEHCKFRELKLLKEGDGEKGRERGGAMGAMSMSRDGYKDAAFIPLNPKIASAPRMNAEFPPSKWLVLQKRKPDGHYRISHHNTPYKVFKLLNGPDGARAYRDSLPKEEQVRTGIILDRAATTLSRWRGTEGTLSYTLTLTSLVAGG